MILKRMNRILLCGLLSVLTAVTSLPFSTQAAETESQLQYGEFTVDDYAEYLSVHEDKYLALNEIKLDILSYVDNHSENFVIEDNGIKAIKLTDAESSVTYDFNVNKAGMYCVKLLYDLGESNMSEAEIDFKINGDFLFRFNFCTAEYRLNRH